MIINCTYLFLSFASIYTPNRWMWWLVYIVYTYEGSSLLRPAATALQMRRHDTYTICLEFWKRRKSMIATILMQLRYGCLRDGVRRQMRLW